MRLWVDDIRVPPKDDNWIWIKTSQKAIWYLNYAKAHNISIERMSLDHDLGGDDTTRAVVLWCCVHSWWPDEVVVHSANPVGVEWLEGMVNRYHPATNPEDEQELCDEV